MDGCRGSTYRRFSRRLLLLENLPLRSSFFGTVPKRTQAVEKVVVELVGGPKIGSNVTKTRGKHPKIGFFVSQQYSEKGTKGFFSTLNRGREAKQQKEAQPSKLHKKPLPLG